MFEVKRLYDPPQKTLTRQNLKLSVEVSRIINGADNHRRGLARVHRIVLEVDLHLRFCFVDIGLARDINERERR